MGGCGGVGGVTVHGRSEMEGRCVCFLITTFAGIGRSAASEICC